MRVLVTGGSGFIGRALVSTLVEIGHDVHVLVSSEKSGPLLDGINCRILIKNLLAEVDADWDEIFVGIDVVVHLAGVAHGKLPEKLDPESTKHHYRKINVDATETLLNHAIASNVKRFIFMSSIGVNGSETYNKVFRASDIPAPVDVYSRSKLEAEKVVKSSCDSSGMDYVIVRPPLVYGPGAPGNFPRLIKLVLYGLPLPFGNVDFPRSLISIDNLVDLVCVSLVHPKACNQILLVSDGVNITLKDLCIRISEAAGKHAFLIPVPIYILKIVAKIPGASALKKLIVPLQIDSERTETLLGWTPKNDLDSVIGKSVKYILEAE